MKIRMMKNAALELSVNFIVIIIISIVVVALGIGLLYKVISQGQKYVCTYDQQTEADLFRRMCAEERVCVKAMEGKNCNAFFNGDEPGVIDNGATGIFSVGIENVGIDEKYFSVVVDNTIAPAGYAWPDNDPNYIKSLSEAPFQLQQNAIKVAQVVIKMPKDAPSGQYVFNVLVCTDQTTSDYNNYDPCVASPSGLPNRYDLKKIYVTNP
jgi:hypothetical protein